MFFPALERGSGGHSDEDPRVAAAQKKGLEMEGREDAIDAVLVAKRDASQPRTIYILSTWAADGAAVDVLLSDGLASAWRGRGAHATSQMTDASEWAACARAALASRAGTAVRLNEDGAQPRLEWVYATTTERGRCCCCCSVILARASEWRQD